MRLSSFVISIYYMVYYTAFVGRQAITKYETNDQKAGMITFFLLL